MNIKKDLNPWIAVGAIFLFFIWAYISGPSIITFAATNISATTTSHWAWNDVIGWIDFYNTNTITVDSRKLTGYASSTAGDISLDCASTRVGNICGQADYAVLNDGSGNLSGWGWNDVYGWISFCGGQGSNPDPQIANNCPGTSVSYRVYVETSGDFRYFAWNDLIGWISFNCADPTLGFPSGRCGTSNYEIETSWVAASATGTLVSSIFDTGVAGGAQINSIVWQGTLPSPANNSWVGFQIAVSNNPAGPWNFVGGVSGSADGWYTAGPNISIPVNYVLHNNARYFRYKVQLTSNLAQTASPKIEDINVNWSK